MKIMWQSMVLCGALATVAATSSQAPEFRNVMHEKLGHTQKILEAVVTSDWTTLETESRELERLTRDPRWMALKYPEYVRQSDAFVRAIEALHTASARRDLEETPQAYIAVTLQCVGCHRYLARQRIAK
jgi:predicted component of type VI protein secretion system